MKNKYFLLIILVILPVLSFSQNVKFTHQDTLRGTIGPARSWWDLIYYHLDITVNPGDSTINGTNTVYYRVIKPAGVMQIDLQPPLVLQKAEQDGKLLEIVKDGNAHFIHMADKQETGMIKSVILTYGGRPKVAVRPPWQ
jgi:hypothetical protein